MRPPLYTLCIIHYFSTKTCKKKIETIAEELTFLFTFPLNKTVVWTATIFIAKSLLDQVLNIKDIWQMLVYVPTTYRSPILTTIELYFPLKPHSKFGEIFALSRSFGKFLFNGNNVRRDRVFLSTKIICSSHRAVASWKSALENYAWILKFSIRILLNLNWSSFGSVHYLWHYVNSKQPVLLFHS